MFQFLFSISLKHTISLKKKLLSTLWFVNLEQNLNVGFKSL